MSARPFGFTVRQRSDSFDPAYKAAVDEFIRTRPDGNAGWSVDPDSPRPPLTDKWSVYLPHRCDEWLITDDPHDEAVVQLELFIAEALQALTALRERREMGEV